MSRIRALSLTLLAFAALFGWVAAPEARAQAVVSLGGKSPKPVTFTAKVEPTSARVGEVVKVTVTATINEPYHIYSSVPAPGDALSRPQPTELTVEGSGLKAEGSIIESAPVIKLDKNFNPPAGIQIGQHEGTATFTQQVRVEKGSGSIPLAVSVRYMACNATSCLPPKTVDIEVSPLTIEVGAARPEFTVVQETSKPVTVAANPEVPAAGTSAVVSLGGKSPKPVTFTAKVEPMPVRVGEVVKVTVTATINEPYHIYSSVPASGDELSKPQPTELIVEGAGLKVEGGVIESTPVIKLDKNFNPPEGLQIGQHEGTATFTQQVRVEKGSGSVPLTVSVRFMACNASNCLPPKTVDIEVPPLTIEAGAARPEFTTVQEAPQPDAVAANPETSAGDAPSGTPSGGLMDATDPSSGGLAGFILTAFGAGLLALITPCVFPMIPVTFAFFTKQATATGKSIVRLASLYSLGIVVTFAAVGGILAKVMGAAGANQIAANPWVNLVFAVLFVVFGLALLEIFELRLPAGIQNLSGKGRDVGGTVGVFFMGLTFVIAAFTCTAPFIGTVLVAASTASSGADWIRPLIGMVSFATALALPFFLLALFPGLLAKLPKSGAWLSTVKGTMGFIELAAALKFLSNTDLVWQWGILTRPVVLALWTVVFLAGAFWLLGRLNLGFATPDMKVPLGRGIWAAAFIGVATYCLFGLTGRPLTPLLDALLPPANYGYGASEKKDALTWHPTLAAGIEQAKQEKRPIFIDFTGYTCTNCRLMEDNVFPVPAVNGELQKFVRVRLYTDNRTDGEKLQEYQEKTFGDVSLPLYGILTPDGTPIAKSVGISEATKFAEFLKSGRERAGGEQVATK
jgi:thiol:disulfide interchange protein DsbD